MKFNKIDYMNIVGANRTEEDLTFAAAQLMISGRGSCDFHMNDGSIVTPDMAIDAGRLVMTVLYWHKSNRPFYRIWPGVLEALANIKFETILKTLPSLEELAPVAFELPIGYEFYEKDGLVRGFLAMVMRGRLIICAPVDNVRMSFNIFSFAPGEEVEANEMQLKLARLALGVLLMAKNDGLFHSVVLNKDKEKYEKTHDVKYVQKAMKYGINGFDVGRNVPTIAEFQAQARKLGATGKKAPHMRLTHPALYWTGEGRTTPVVRIIETLFINYEDIRNIPQGYYIKK